MASDQFPTRGLPALRSARATRIAPEHDARTWLAALDSKDAASARPLKTDHDTAVYAATLQGREVVIKIWSQRSLGARLKLAARMARGDRHWRGAAWLLDQGFPTARPLLLATDRGPKGPRQWLVMEFVHGPTVLDCITGGLLSPQDEHRLAEALADQLSDMVARGRFNRDHKPSNLIVTRAPSGGPVAAIIDCVAIRPCRKFDFASMQRMLASLYIEPLGLGLPPRRTLCMRALAAIQAKSWWRQLRGAIVAHGDPRSRVDPRSAAPKDTEPR